jgi:HK97 family phage major capsid protein
MALAERLDAARDAAALLRARHDGDREAIDVILDHGDPVAIAEALAATLHSVITATRGGCRDCTDEFITTWQRALRSLTAGPRKGTTMTPTEQEAIEAAARPKGCGRCGRTFGNSTAYSVHFESGPGTRCLPGDAYGQLIEVSGVWCVPGSDTARLSVYMTVRSRSISIRDHRLAPGQARLPGFKETAMPQTPDQARGGYAARTGKSLAHETHSRLTETPASQALRMIAAQGKIGFQALSAVAENVEIQERALGLRVTEKRTYQRGDSSRSYFQDLMSRETGYGYPAEARARLDRHAAEVRADAPVARARMEARAAAEYERHIAGSREGEQALARMQRLGIRPFETRAIDTSSGSAGDFTPPQWLLEDWVQAPRTGHAFADLWPTLPVMMNAGVSVNVPRWSTGLSAAPQTSAGAPIAGSSPADTYSTCPIRTIAGYADISAQWAEQGVRIADDVVFAELMADQAASLDAQLLIGSGSSGQLTGVIKSGTISSSNMAVLTAANSSASQTWLFNGGSGTPLWTAASALPGLMAKGRGKRPTHLVISPQTWDQVTGTLDGNLRPLVPPSATAPAPGGLVDMYGYPVLVHEGLPNSFGGSAAPSVSTAGGGVFGYADGTGTTVYSVLIAVRAPDLLLFQSAPRTEIFKDVTSGTLQWRFRISGYYASFADRYVSAAGVSGYGNGGDVSGTIGAGASTITGVVKAFQTASPMAAAY